MSGHEVVRADAAAHAILAILPAHPVITADSAARFIGTSPTAARAALRALEARAILEPYGLASAQSGRPRQWWLARALADLVRT